jgi:hypothetical protein
MRVLLASTLFALGCGGAQTTAPAPTPPQAPVFATPTALPSGVETGDVQFAEMAPPEALDRFGVVRFDGDGEQACGVTREGRVFCAHPDGSTFELTGFPPAIDVEVGNGCGEPLCILTADHVAMCITTRIGEWDPRERIEMPNVQDLSMHGCFGCAVSLDGHLACFGARTDHRAFLQPPRLVAGLDHVTEVQVEAARICVNVNRERIVCAAE